MEQTGLKAFIRIGIRKRTSFVDILYGEKVGDPLPFILSVSPQYVARKICHTLPLNVTQIQDYAAKHADTALRDIAISRRNAGYTAHVL